MKQFLQTTITKTYKIPVFKYTKKDSGTNEGLAGAIFTLSKNSNGEQFQLNLVKTSAEDAAEDIYRVAKAT